MSDLTSRQAAIDAIEDLISARREWLCDARDEIKGLDAAICEIENLPSAQPELIRCKNCEYWYPEEDDEYGHCRKHDFWTSGVWFCADGDRGET